MQTLRELLDQQSVLNRQITALRLAERARAVAEIHALLEEHGLTASDVASSSSATRRKSQVAGKKVAAKYRDPGSGATWSGRGLKPRWMSEALAAGKTLDEFAL